MYSVHLIFFSNGYTLSPILDASGEQPSSLFHHFSLLDSEEPPRYENSDLSKSISVSQKHYRYFLTHHLLHPMFIKNSSNSNFRMVVIIHVTLFVGRSQMNRWRNLSKMTSQYLNI